jgi:hypothetical protein
VRACLLSRLRSVFVTLAGSELDMPRSSHSVALGVIG